MGRHVKVQDLVGIGKRYDLGLLSEGQRVSVVLHKDGRRELYAFEKSAEDPSAVLELSEDESRMLGAVLTGTYFED
jgi:TrkA domain protein